VSKQSQLKKNKKPPATRGRKRTAAAISTPCEDTQIAETLARIETQQRQQQSLINSLIQTVAVLSQTRQAGSGASTPAVADVDSPHQVLTEDEYDLSQARSKRVKLEHKEIDLRSTTSQQPSPASQEASLQFEHHLSGLMATFSQMAPAERASCIHRVFQDHSSRASEVVEALLTESLTTGQSDNQRLDTATGETADPSDYHLDGCYDPIAYGLPQTTALPDAEASFQHLLHLQTQLAKDSRQS